MIPINPDITLVIDIALRMRDRGATMEHTTELLDKLRRSHRWRRDYIAIALDEAYGDPGDDPTGLLTAAAHDQEARYALNY